MKTVLSCSENPLLGGPIFMSLEAGNRHEDCPFMPSVSNVTSFFSGTISIL